MRNALGDSEPQEPVISLVVNTRDRASVLAPSLESLRRLSCPRPWELVLVDNGSSDATPGLLAAFASGADMPCSVLREATPGLGRARNRGWQAARGPIVCFTDDDCYPAADLLPQMLAAFADPAIGFVAGRILLHDASDLPIGIKSDPERRFYPPHFAFPPGELHGANLAFRRVVLETIGGFDELTGAGTPYPFEDIDAIMRASLAGFAGAYDPRPTVSHHHRRRGGEALRKIQHGYARGRGAYFAKFLLGPGPRLTLLKRWLGCMRYHGLRWLPTEIAAAVEYLIDSRRERARRATPARSAGHA